MSIGQLQTGGEGGRGLGGTRMILFVVPIEYGGDVGSGAVFKLIAEKFHGDMP
jgi:hypothetical protein